MYLLLLFHLSSFFSLFLVFFFLIFLSLILPSSLQLAIPAYSAQPSPIITEWIPRIMRFCCCIPSLSPFFFSFSVPSLLLPLFFFLFLNRARHHYDIARNISLNGFGDSDPVAITTAFILLSDYAPSEKEYTYYSWRTASQVCPLPLSHPLLPPHLLLIINKLKFNIKIKPGTSMERHVYFYARCYQACANDESISYRERLDLLLRLPPFYLLFIFICTDLTYVYIHLYLFEYL